MQTVEIPHEAWAPTLNSFTAIHQGWLVSLDVLGSTIRAQSEIRDLPLFSVATDTADHEEAIAISASRSADERITHRVYAPTRVQLQRREDGAAVALQIESADGTKTILRFRTAALPETVDGIVRP
jgi:hypothetical protein